MTFWYPQKRISVPVAGKRLGAVFNEEPELDDSKPSSSTRRKQQGIAVVGNGGHSLVP